MDFKSLQFSVFENGFSAVCSFSRDHRQVDDAPGSGSPSGSILYIQNFDGCINIIKLSGQGNPIFGDRLPQ
ncbi:MAG: hypothetical protein AAFZ15_26495 [Bacteroidota bacterium]